MVRQGSPERSRRVPRTEEGCNYHGLKTLYIRKTTVLELEWGLRSAYKLPSKSILHSILTICGLPNVTVENAWQVAQACELYSKGLDFADALHYSANTSVEKFYTFDEKFIRNGQTIKFKNH